jgi:hypothetical protein
MLPGGLSPCGFGGVRRAQHTWTAGALSADRALINSIQSADPVIMAKRHLYKVIFVNQGKVYEIYARSVIQGSLFGFIEVEQLVFGERTTVVVDPSEERLKSEFETVTRTYIPMHAVIRIDEVEKQGPSKISSIDGSNVSPFPMPLYTPGGQGGGSGRDS